MLHDKTGFPSKWTVHKPQFAVSHPLFTQKEIDDVVKYVIENVKFYSNMRGSKEYRQILSKVFINRGISEITGGSYGN